MPADKELQSDLQPVNLTIDQIVERLTAERMFLVAQRTVEGGGVVRCLRACACCVQLNAPFCCVQSMAYFAAVTDNNLQLLFELTLQPGGALRCAVRTPHGAVVAPLLSSIQTLLA